MWHVGDGIHREWPSQMLVFNLLAIAGQHQCSASRHILATSMLECFWPALSHTSVMQGWSHVSNWSRFFRWSLHLVRILQLIQLTMQQTTGHVHTPFLCDQNQTDVLPTLVDQSLQGTAWALAISSAIVALRIPTGSMDFTKAFQLEVDGQSTSTRARRPFHSGIASL